MNSTNLLVWIVINSAKSVGWHINAMIEIYYFFSYWNYLIAKIPGNEISSRQCCTGYTGNFWAYGRLLGNKLIIYFLSKLEIFSLNGF